MKTLLRIAWIAGVAPIFVGTAIFIIWLIFRADALMAAGVITIYAGLASVVVGLICLAIYLWRNWRSSEVPRRYLVWQTTSLIILFLANFVAAAGFVYGAIMIETRYHLSITNGGNEPLRNVRVGVGPFGVDFGDIPAGETRKKSFWIEGEGELRLTATRGGRQIEAVADGYVTCNMGGDVKVTVNSLGEVVAEYQRSDLASRSQQPSSRASACAVAARKDAVLQLGQGVRALVITPDGSTLFALTEDKLLSIEPEELVVQKAISLIQGKSGEKASSYWSRENLVCSPSGKHVVVDNLVIDVRQMKAVTTLEIDGVLAKGQPDPFPLAVSPDEQLALIYLRSFHAERFDRICVYELKTGKFVDGWGTAGEVRTAIFNHDGEVFLFHSDGTVTARTVGGTSPRTLGMKVPTVLPYSTVLMIHGGHETPSCVVMAGQHGEDRVVAAFSLPDVDLVEQWAHADFGPVSATQGAMVAYFDVKEGALCRCGKHPLFDPILLIRDLTSGAVSQIAIQRIPSHAVLATDGRSLFASDRDEVVRWAIPSNTGKR